MYSLRRRHVSHFRHRHSYHKFDLTSAKTNYPPPGYFTISLWPVFCFGNIFVLLSVVADVEIFLPLFLLLDFGLFVLISKSLDKSV